MKELPNCVELLWPYTKCKRHIRVWLCDVSFTFIHYSICFLWMNGTDFIKVLMFPLVCLWRVDIVSFASVTCFDLVALICLWAWVANIVSEHFQCGHRPSAKILLKLHQMWWQDYENDQYHYIGLQHVNICLLLVSYWLTRILQELSLLSERVSCIIFYHKINITN